jgi:hypothetical protein
VKKVLYTAIIGNYDRLFPVPLNLRMDWDLRCFTDQQVQSDCWEIIEVDRGEMSSVALARKIKILSQEYIPDADISIWIDASRQVIRSLNAFADNLGPEDFVCIRHPQRDCVYQEMDVCLKQKKAHPARIAVQKKDYSRMGIPAHGGLQHTGVLLRRQSAKCAEINNLWWTLTDRYATWRDQLTLPVAFSRLNYRPKTLDSGAIKKFTIQRVSHKGIFAGNL